MRKISIFLLFLAAFILSGCAPKAPIEGFRDMKFGGGIEKLDNYTITYDNKTSKIVSAVKKDDKLQIGDAKLTGIEYHFFDNMLYAVTAKYSGSNNNDIIMQTIESKYGLDSVTDKEYISYVNGYKIVNNKVVENIEYQTRRLLTPSFWSVRSGDADIDGVCIDITDCRMTIINRKIIKTAANYAEKAKKIADKIRENEIKKSIEKGFNDL
ncbi:MAG: hypothetical protein LBB59_02335 [Campylobacteraceae bacterium]|jgi:hypothetical protein|nr:hypothetical protein [Campylobacteraceae bacterium]